MSEQHKTPEEDVEAYANTYCDDDQEQAAGHSIVKEVCKSLKSE